MTPTPGRSAGTSRPSMADVARLAGVSSQTVSRVSNGQANVDEATRARVLEAMQSLGYRPNGAARAQAAGAGPPSAGGGPAGDSSGRSWWCSRSR